MSPRPLLAVGELSDEHRALLQGECEAAGFEPTWTSSVETAAAKLSSTAFDLLLIDLTTPGAASVCIKARGKLQRGRFPIIALVEELDDANFVKAFRAGADEVIPLGASGRLSSRLKDLSRPSRMPADRARGEALLVDADRTRAEVLERMLSDAGYRVDVARDELAAKLNLGRPHVKLVVVDASMPNVRSLFEQSRKKGSRSVWIVRARPEQLVTVTRTFQRGEPVSVVSSVGPPDDVLFESNRLLDDSQPAQRTGPRLLYGTVVSFSRDDGVNDYGFSYNIGPTGLFVRTLALPRSDAITLQVKIGSEGAELSLEGEVVWRRPFGPTQKQSAPPGFGVRISGGALSEWARAFREAYAELHGDFDDSPAPAPAPEPVERALRKPSRPDMRAITPGAPRAAPAPTPPGPPVALAHKPREPLSSVEEMLSDALSRHDDAESTPGSVPLAVNTFELDRPGTPLVSPSPDLKTTPPRALESDKPSKASSLEDDPELATIPPKKQGEAGGSREDVDISDQVTMRPPADYVPEGESSPPPSIPTDEPFSEVMSTDLISTRAPPPEEAPAPKPHAIEPPPKPQAIEPPPKPATGYVVTMLGLPRMHATSEAAAAPTSDTPPSEPSKAGEPSSMSETSPVSEPPPTRDVQPATRTTEPADSKPSDAEAPHSSATDVAARPEKPTSKKGTFAALAVAAGIIAGVFVALGFRPPSKSERPAKPVPVATVLKTTATATPAPAPENETPTPASADPDPTPAPSAESPATEPPAAAGPSATAAIVEAEKPATAEAPAQDAPPLDKLPADHAVLFVESSLDSRVFVHGVDVGKTNQMLVSRCGPRFVRLGAAPGQWQSEGLPVKIRCGALTRVKIK